MAMTGVERSHKWRLSHVAEKKLMDASWRERNPERSRALRRAYYARHRDIINAKRRAKRKFMDSNWVERNPERSREIRLAYYNRNRDAINARRRARRAASRTGTYMTELESRDGHYAD